MRQISYLQGSLGTQPWWLGGRASASHLVESWSLLPRWIQILLGAWLRRQNTSFETIHRLAKRGTPTQMSTYKNALQLFKLYNSNNMSADWVSLNAQQTYGDYNLTHQIYFSFYKVVPLIYCKLPGC